MDMADLAVTAALVLVENALPYLDRALHFHDTVRDGLKDIQVWLSGMQAYLRDMDGNEGSELERERVKQVRGAANQIEDVLDEFMHSVTHRTYKHQISNKVHRGVNTARSLIPGSSLHDIPSEIDRVKRMMDNIMTINQLFPGGPRGMVSPGEGSTSGRRLQGQLSTPATHDNEEIVGFEEPRKAIEDRLIGEASRRTTLFVVGPGGSGKTILVKDIYGDKVVREYFHCHAWVQVSQSFITENLLRCMLTQFCGSRKEPLPPAEGGVKDLLWDYLELKRYVVVLDDIRTREQWECIQRVLPTGPYGSRIIVTAQNSMLASSCADSLDYIHELNRLPRSESWKLFCKKAFQTDAGECPSLLREWSEKIVRKCDGLPLAIVALGNLLSKREHVPLEWKKVHDNLGYHTEDLPIISKTILPSYRDLPPNLKSCLLYFSMFPEGYCVERGRLIRLWIAEGFVSKKMKKTLEEVAEDYLNELIGRNLVYTSKWDFDGRARHSRIRNFIHDFLIQKSEDNDFALVVSGPGTRPIRENVRRISIHSACLDSGHSTNMQSVRSMFFFNDAINLQPSVIAKILHSCKLLKVLDLRDVPLDTFPNIIVYFSLLRYLSLRHTNIKKIPKSIQKLSCLETLDLKQTYVTQLPGNIGRLLNLRHLLVYRTDVKDEITFDAIKGVEGITGIGALRNLQKLSVVNVDKHRKIIEDLGALTQLKKLVLIKLKLEDGRLLCASVEKMQDLSTFDVSSTSQEEILALNAMSNPPPHLQRLYLRGRLTELPKWISSLHSLFRIGLMWSRLKTCPLETLQELPNLKELQMVDAFTGQRLLFRSGSFTKLKILYIEQFECLRTVVIQEGAMSQLQKMTLCKCENLNGLPQGIYNLTQLEDLDLY